LQVFKGFDNVQAYARFIGDVTVFPNVETIVNAPAKVLGKVAVDVLTNGWSILL